MNTPSDITPFDLLQLALDEFKRHDDLYEEFADDALFDIVLSARLAHELVSEAVEVAAERAHDSVGRAL